MSAKQRVYEVVEVARRGDRASAIFDWFIITLIVLNILSFVVESYEPIRSAAPGFFRMFETISVAVFSVEYLARLWSCTSDPKFPGPLRGRLRKAMRPMMLVDLVAILPFYLPMVSLDLRAFRAIRLFRILRILKLGRYTKSLMLIRRVLVEKREEMAITAGFMLTLMLLSSTLMYYAERNAQPEHFGSIPAAMWWAVVTLSTVGYGDAYPVTTVGRAIAAMTAIFGIAMFALPTGILGAGFVEEIARSKQRSGTCPTCGQALPRTGGS